MRKSAVALCAFIMAFSVLPLRANLAAIHSDALPQETAVLAALDDAKQLEPYSAFWTADSLWKFPPTKSEVATRLGKDLGFLTLAAKDHPDNAELLLLTGLVARYAYNVDVDGSHDVAMNMLNQAEKLTPSDFRVPWFRGTLECQTEDTAHGAKEFLSIEASHAWDQLPVAFWDDYTECAYLANMPAHVLRAADHLQKLLAPNSERRNAIAGFARKRFDPFDPKMHYKSEEVWRTENADQDVVYTSTVCGLRLHVRGSWSIGEVEYGKSSCLASYGPGPYSAVKDEPQTALIVEAEPPAENETLQDFAVKYEGKLEFEPFTPAECPASKCIGMKGAKSEQYKENGGEKWRVVAFESDQPDFPGLIFESPLELPKPADGAGPTVYHPSQIRQRIPGKLYYLVMLDTAASIEEPAMKDFDFFLQNLTVE